MKATKAALGLLGGLAAFSVQGQEPHGDMHLRHGLSSETTAKPGLLGTYPLNRDASGTSWQPDSTPPDFTEDRFRWGTRPGAAFDEGLWTVRSMKNGGTIGVQAVTEFDPALDASGTSNTYSWPRLDRLSNGYITGSERRAPVDLAAFYKLPVSGRSSVFGYVGLPGEPALGPPTSQMQQRFFRMQNSLSPIDSDWPDSARASTKVVTLGYVWRNLKVEGSAFSNNESEQQQPVKSEWDKFVAKSGRLSFNPSRNWALQLSRGHIGSLDQFELDGKVRRTTISATYNRSFNDGNWQTTFAWGRNSRKLRESTMGYLVESTLKLKSAYAFFGRLELVGADDLARENESYSKQMFKMNKLTVGYLYDPGIKAPVALDVGGMVSKHFVPSAMTPSYGSDPMSFMMFVRFKIR